MVNLLDGMRRHKLRHGVPPLSVYTSYFYFCLSFWFVGSAISIYFM